MTLKELALFPYKDIVSCPICQNAYQAGNQFRKMVANSCYLMSAVQFSYLENDPDPRIYAVFCPKYQLKMYPQSLKEGQVLSFLNERRIYLPQELRLENLEKFFLL